MTRNQWIVFVYQTGTVGVAVWNAWSHDVQAMVVSLVFGIGFPLLWGWKGWVR